MKKFKVIQDYGKKVRVECVCGRKHRLNKKYISRYKCVCEREDSNDEFQNLFNRYKTSALKRGYTFKITKEHFKHVIKGRCYYCGELPKQKIGKLVYNGIDRLDSSIGYEVGNVASCCGTCNKAKGTMDMREFETWIRKVNVQLETKDKLEENIYKDTDSFHKYLFTRGLLLKDYVIFDLIQKRKLSPKEIVYDYKKANLGLPEHKIDRVERLAMEYVNGDLSVLHKITKEDINTLKKLGVM